MTRIALFALLAALTASCGGKDTNDTDGGEGGVIGDGVTPVLDKAEWACFEDANGGKFFYFRLTVRDQQGSDTIASNGGSVLFKKSNGEPVWVDGSGNPAAWELVCKTDTDPRKCEYAVPESAESGACDGTTHTFEGWATDVDGNESTHTEDFVVNSAILPTG
jgi:hypothetical protein